MPRIKGWERALLDEVERHKALPFAWDGSNCVYFPMDCVKAITGADPWEDERGCESETDFARRLVKHGFKNVGDVFAAKFAEIPTAYMGRGDIATVDQEVCTPGVVCLGGMLVGKSEQGMIYIPRGLALRAFKVG
jgi:hypothetical protein